MRASLRNPDRRIAAFLVLAYGITWVLEGMGLLASGGRSAGE